MLQPLDANAQNDCNTPKKCYRTPWVVRIIFQEKNVIKKIGNAMPKGFPLSTNLFLIKPLPTKTSRRDFARKYHVQNDARTAMPRHASTIRTPGLWKTNPKIWKSIIPNHQPCGDHFPSPQAVYSILVVCSFASLFKIRNHAPLPWHAMTYETAVPIASTFDQIAANGSDCAIVCCIHVFDCFLFVYRSWVK